MYYEFDHTKMENDEVISTIEYDPSAGDHKLQRRITELMDRLVQNDSRFTLAELGYLHMNTLLYDRETGRVNLKVYFDVHYSCRVVKDKTNSRRSIMPVDELNVFQNYLFVGPVVNAVTFETIMAPKTKKIEDEQGRPSLSFKDDAKFVETEVLVLNCNLPVAMAAVHDIDLKDPLYKVRCTAIAKSGSNKESMVISSGNKKEIPVKLTITVSGVTDDDNSTSGFDTVDVKPFLVALRERNLNKAKNQSKLTDKARDKAEKKQDKRLIANKRAFDRFS